MKRLFLVLFVAACSPSGLSVTTTPSATLQVGGLTRELDAVYDLDDVRDVADANGTLAVATDRGVLLFADPESPPTRVLDGLPSPDVRALATTADGTLVVGTTAGIGRLRGATFEPLGEAPVGELVALTATSSGALFACGATGLARRTTDTWETFGEPFACTGLWPTPEEHLWVGTTRGLLYVEGDVVREHGESGGLPGGYVRGVVSAGTGRALALVQGPSDAWIVFFDGERWSTYTVANLERRPIGLARLGADAILVTSDHAFVIRDAARANGGVPLRALSRGPHRPALSYRARLGREPVGGSLERRDPVPLAAVPPNAPTVAAPGFGIAHLTRVATAATFAKTIGNEVIVADRSRGVVSIGSSSIGGEGIGPRRSSRSLVDERDLQIAADERGRLFTVDGLGRLGRWQDGSFAPVAPPEGARAWAIAAASRGLYLAATRDADPSVIAIFRREGDAWTPVVERRLTGPETPTTLVETGTEGTSVETGTLAPNTTIVSLPFLGVADDETAWVAVRVLENGQPRRKGVVQLSARSEAVLHHHVGQPAGGDGALQIPDDVANVDLAQSGFAWFSSVVGAVRLGNSQSVTFGEARGVRGEVVSDVLVGTGNRVWVAAAEGPGYYFQQSFEFRMPQAVRAARPIALALDPNGHVWGAGPNGLVRYDGNDWQVLGADVLPITSFVDVESDPEGRLWVLAQDRVLIVGPGRRIEN